MPAGAVAPWLEPGIDGGKLPGVEGPPPEAGAGALPAIELLGFEGDAGAWSQVNSFGTEGSAVELLAVAFPGREVPDAAGDAGAAPWVLVSGGEVGRNCSTGAEVPGV